LLGAAHFVLNESFHAKTRRGRKGAKEDLIFFLRLCVLFASLRENLIVIDYRFPKTEKSFSPFSTSLKSASM